MTRISSRSNNALGFTLIELLVVLAIISLLAVLLVPRLGVRPAGLTRREAITKITSVIDEAKREAGSSGQMQLVDPKDVIVDAEFADPAFGQSDGRLRVYSDGSTSGGILVQSHLPLVKVAWLTGEVTNAR